MILLGVAEGDSELDAELLCRKIVNLRIFTDEEGKMNRSIKDVDGEMLVISQFTLMANYRHGNRPDFLASAKPEDPHPQPTTEEKYHETRPAPHPGKPDGILRAP